MKSLYARILKEDISQFRADKDAPKTEELDLMKSKNIQPIDQYMKALIESKDHGAFLKVKLDGTTKHIIKFKIFEDNFKKWLAENVSTEYVPKPNQIRQKLKNMNNGFTASRPVRYTENKVSKVEKFSVFDFATMIEYLDDYIFTEIEHEVVDIGEVVMPKPPKIKDYGAMLDSR